MSDNIVLIQDDCLNLLRELPDNSIDSLVTDPPAGISFMNKEWDSDKGGRDGWIAWMTEIMKEVHRVLKPGAHGLVWAIPRTSHWTANALEDAGFEVRDVVTHLFGTGFPKSMDISKAIYKAAGAEREVIGHDPVAAAKANKKLSSEMNARYRNSPAANDTGATITAPSTDAAKQWQGWGTALKPASEHWILVRKPCSEKTVAANVQKWGTGAINIDASRIALDGSENLSARQRTTKLSKEKLFAAETREFEGQQTYCPHGRFPANLVLTEGEATQMLDEQSEGGASRFFYCAKTSTSERNAGCEDLPDVVAGIGDDRPSGQSMSRLDGRPQRVVKNSHPTVKSKKLMSYLVKMITPPNGIVLDPFMGSGSTGIAAKELGHKFLGIEKEPEYFAIAEQRIKIIKSGG